LFNNQDYPWYLQQSVSFSTLYNAMFDIASAASPIGIADSFDLEHAVGQRLYNIGALWGVNSAGVYFDGMIYNFDKWSQGKVWTGGVKPVAEEMYRRFVRMIIWANGRPFSLNTLHEVLEIAFEGYTHTITVSEDEAEHHFTINIKADETIIRLFIEMRAFVARLLGKPSGYSYDFNFTYNEPV